MDCKEFEKDIPSFINRKMDYLTLKDFYAHMQSCGDCREELTIHFLVSDGLQRLEAGEAFDLQKEWNVRMEEAKRKLSRNAAVLQTGFWAEILAVGVIAGIVMWLLI